MFRSKKTFLITPEMSKYIKDSTNKSIKNYFNKYKINALLVKDISPNYIALLPIVSLISFLAGYNFNMVLN
jgi:hypothetical protein